MLLKISLMFFFHAKAAKSNLINRCVFSAGRDSEQHLSGMLKAFPATEDHEEWINMRTQPRLIPYRRRKTN